jgi:hypothetical protein
VGGSGSEEGALGGRADGTTGGPSGVGGGAPGSRSAATNAAISERDAWIEAHGRVVNVPGESSGAMTLYYFSGSN